MQSGPRRIQREDHAIGGYETIVAAGGLEALEVLNREAVDCVILDLEMPAVDGFETLRAFTREKIRTPVIVYTGTGNYDRCIQAVRLGAYGFIDKAEPMERVVQEIENALARHRLSGEVEVLRELGTFHYRLIQEQLEKDLKSHQVFEDLLRYEKGQ